MVAALIAAAAGAYLTIVAVVLLFVRAAAVGDRQREQFVAGLRRHENSLAGVSASARRGGEEVS